jgi:hypothetical protein
MALVTDKNALAAEWRIRAAKYTKKNLLPDIEALLVNYEVAEVPSVPASAPDSDLIFDDLIPVEEPSIRDLQNDYLDKLEAAFKPNFEYRFSSKLTSFEGDKVLILTTATVLDEGGNVAYSSYMAKIDDQEVKESPHKLSSSLGRDIFDSAGVKRVAMFAHVVKHQVGRVIHFDVNNSKGRFRIPLVCDNDPVKGFTLKPFVRR